MNPPRLACLLLMLALILQVYAKLMLRISLDHPSFLLSVLAFSLIERVLSPPLVDDGTHLLWRMFLLNVHCFPPSLHFLHARRNYARVISPSASACLFRLRYNEGIRRLEQEGDKTMTMLSAGSSPLGFLGIGQRYVSR